MHVSGRTWKNKVFLGGELNESSFLALLALLSLWSRRAKRSPYVKRAVSPYVRRAILPLYRDITVTTPFWGAFVLSYCSLYY